MCSDKLSVATSPSPKSHLYEVAPGEEAPSNWTVNGIVPERSAGVVIMLAANSGLAFLLKVKLYGGE